MEDWPFDEPENVTAITTRQVIEDGLPILCVVHYAHNHLWAFTCGTTSATEDGRVISMGAALAIDPTLRSVADLPTGYCAYREAVGAPWAREPSGYDAEPRNGADE